MDNNKVFGKIAGRSVRIVYVTNDQYAKLIEEQIVPATDWWLYRLVEGKGWGIFTTDPEAFEKALS